MAVDSTANGRDPVWRTAAYCVLPFAILLALGIYAAFILVPLVVFAISMGRQGRAARPVVWSFGIAAGLAVVLAGALAFPQDHAVITDSGGAQVVDE